MSKKQGVKKGANTSMSYIDRLTIKANCHDEEQRFFGRVFMCDMWTIVLGRTGYREKRFERIDKLLSEVCDEYSTDILNGAEDDRDVWYQKGALDREIKSYVGKMFVPWEERYGFKPEKPTLMTNLTDIRSMPVKELAHFLATWEKKSEEEVLEWLKETREDACKNGSM